MGKKKKRAPAPVIQGPVVDSHCHLEQGSYEDRDEVIRRAFDAGLAAMIAIGSGYGPENGARALALAKAYPGRIWATAGLHPHQADQWSDEVRSLILEVAKAPEVVAVGEAGLDYHYEYSPRAAQREAFIGQIRLARELELPITIHDRESQGEVLEILKAEGAFEGRVLYHCYSGTWPEAEKILALGGYLSIPGVVTYKSATEMKEVATKAPLNRLMVETDSPYLTPAPWRGKRNEPARVLYTLQEVARLREISNEEAAFGTTSAVESFYNISVKS